MALKLGVIIASIRDNRLGRTIGEWVLEKHQSLSNEDVSFEIVDLKDYLLPFHGITHTKEEKRRIKAWQDKMTELDGFIFVEPEYNRVVPSSLSNAWAYVWPEVKNKVAGFVGYGFLGGARGIFSFRAAVSIVEVAIIQKEININYASDFDNFGTKEMTFKPGVWHDKGFEIQHKQLTTWARALKEVREGKFD